MLKDLLKKIFRSESRRKLPAPTPTESAALVELQAAFRDLPVENDEGATAAEAAWIRNMNRLRELVLTQDPRHFLRWDVVRATMFVSKARYIATELAYLKQHRAWQERWSNAIEETAVGDPIPCVEAQSSSANLVHHAYHVARFEDTVEHAVQKCDFVFEFGGGYGSMCRLIHKLGFSGRYVIFDLPPFSALQRFYLTTLGLPICSADEFGGVNAGVFCVSDRDELQRILQINGRTSDRLFLATWSLSETPLKVREAVEPFLEGFHSFLVAYQHRFGEVDNVAYFSNWQARMSNLTWHDSTIPHLPGSNYLLAIAGRD